MVLARTNSKSPLDHKPSPVEDLAKKCYQLLCRIDPIHTQFYPVWTTRTVIHFGREVRFMADEDYLDSLKAGDIVVSLTPLTLTTLAECQKRGIGVVDPSRATLSLTTDRWHSMIHEFLKENHLWPSGK